MLTKADRNTRVMVNTPTRVLFILDLTIFLERVCSGAGKSCPGEESERTEVSGRQQTTTGELVKPTLLPTPTLTPGGFLMEGRMPS